MLEEEESRKIMFLKELTALSLKHGLLIFGCGCCNSPSLSVLDKQDVGEYVLNPGSAGEPEIEWKERIVKP